MNAQASAVRLVPLLVAVALLASCGSGSGWTKPGMTEAELSRDTQQCMNESRQVLAGRDGPRVQIDQDRYRRCMTGLGYAAEAKN